jgi:hydrogenase nickel incorporation protein HypA/HybF
MHELSIAMSILEFAEEEAARRGETIEAVHVRIGAMSGIVKEALASAYELACESSATGPRRLEIEVAPVLIYCGRCEAERTAPSPQMLCCPDCVAPAEDIVGGTELQVIGLELAS